MSAEEVKKKSYDDILLHLCLTKDDKIKPVLYKFIPVLLNELLINQGTPPKTLIEIVSHCILRCKSFERIDIPLSDIVGNYLQHVGNAKGNRILYNSTLSIFLDIGFKSVDDGEKMKFQKMLIENGAQLSADREMGILMMIKFIECLEILNDEKNKKEMEEYFSREGNKEEAALDNQIVQFIKHMNEFLAIPIYCKNVEEIKFLPSDVIKIYKDKFRNSKNYSVQNHIKMKKNTLYFLSSFVCNHNLSYASYVICCTEKYDEIKEYANSLLLGKKRFVNFNDAHFIATNLDILKYFDNNMYPVQYAVKILTLFLNSSEVAIDRAHIHTLMSYIFFFFFHFVNDMKNIHFETEFSKFQVLFHDKKEFVKFLNRHGYTIIRLKNEDLKKCLFSLMLFILEKTPNEFLHEYIECIFHLIFCYLKGLDEEGTDADHGGSDNYGVLTDISTMIDKFFEKLLREDKINMTVLGRAYTLAYSFFDKLKRFKRRSSESYIRHNDITRVLFALEKYFQRCMQVGEVVGEGVQQTGKCVDRIEENVESCGHMGNSISSGQNGLFELKGKKKGVPSTHRKDIRKIIAQNVEHLLDQFVPFADNALLISVVIKWAVSIFASGSCECVYYPLLFERSSNVVLSDLARDYLKGQNKEKKISFDEYTFFISKKLFRVNDGCVVRPFGAAYGEVSGEDGCVDKVWDGGNYDGSNYGECNCEKGNCEEESLKYSQIAQPSWVATQSADFATEYANTHYAEYRLDQLHNLLEYYKKITFCSFSHVESVYYALLILDLFLIGTVNRERNMKEDYLVVYCSVFTLILKRLRTFLKRIKKEEVDANFRRKQFEILKNSERGLYTHLVILAKIRMQLILSNMLYVGNHKLVKKATKLLTRIYMLGKETHANLFDDLVIGFKSENVEKVAEKSKEESYVLCAHMYLFGYLIKKEKQIDERYSKVVEVVTNCLLHTHHSYVKEKKKIEQPDLLRYCFKFLRLVFFSRHFVQTWLQMVKESSYSELPQGGEDCAVQIRYIVEVIMEILKYAKGNLNGANICLVKNVLKLLSCLPTLRDDGINAILKEDIRDSVHVDNLQIQQLYGRYISQMILRLEKTYADKIASDFLSSILDHTNVKEKGGNKFLCIILCYVINYNPFLEHIKRNFESIADFFISLIKLRSDIYSEYCFVGLSSLFFALSVQSIVDINDVENLLRALWFLKGGKKSRGKGTTVEEVNGVTTFSNDVEGLARTSKMEAFSNVAKLTKEKNTLLRKERKMSCNILEQAKDYLDDISLLGESKGRIPNQEESHKQATLENKGRSSIGVPISMVEKETVEKFAEGVYRTFSDANENLLYKTYFRKKEKEVDNNFINEIKKFESRKDYVLNNVYDYVSSERNIELIGHYTSLGRHCFNYVYAFLFMQYSDLALYRCDKKVRDFFAHDVGKYDGSGLDRYGMTYLLGKLRGGSNIDQAGSSEQVHSYQCVPSSSVYDFKKANKRLCHIVKAICKELLVRVIKARHEIIKLKIFQHISVADVSRTMKRVEREFLQMNFNSTDSACVMDALNTELTTFVADNHNELINDATLIFVTDILKKIDLKTFCQKMGSFLSFICAVIESALMNKEICITFLNTFKSACVRFFSELGIPQRGNHVGVGGSGLSTLNSAGSTQEQGVTPPSGEPCTTKLHSKKEEETPEEDHPRGSSHTNEIIQKLLQYYQKFESKKKVELYFRDCLNSCILSSEGLGFHVKTLLQFYIRNSEKMETDYTDLAIPNEGKDDSYTKKELFFIKLVKYNNLEKEKEILEKIISNYEHLIYIEESVKHIFSFLFEENNVGKFMLSSVSFVIVKLLDKYEVLLKGNAFLNVQFCITVFSSISEFISKHMCNCYLSYMNDLVYYLVHRIPFYHYVKFVHCTLLGDHFESTRHVRDVQQARNYCSEVILYLLKKKYLLDLDDENIFRDQRRVGDIKQYEDLKMVHDVNFQVKEFIGGGRFKEMVEQEIGGTPLGCEDRYLERADASNCLPLLTLIGELVRSPTIVDQEVILHQKSDTEERVRKYVEKKLTLLGSNHNVVISAHLRETVTKVLTAEIVSVCKKEMEQKKTFEEENKMMLKKMESKLIATSFIIKNMKNIDNNYYKDVYEILQKRNIFHFYKFFSEYVEQFHTFLDSTFTKDKKACFTSIEKFIDFFIDMYKCENCDELEGENVEKFLNLFYKIRDLFRGARNGEGDLCFFSILALLKCLTFMLFLLVRSKANGDKMENVSVNLRVIVKGVQVDEGEIYTLFNEILDALLDVREFELFQHMYLFVFNIPSTYLENFNFVKLWKCVLFFINKYFHSCNESVSNYDSSLCVHFFKLGMCLLCYFLSREDDMRTWLHLFNYQYLNRLFKMEHLHSFRFETNEEYRQEDIVNGMRFEEAREAQGGTNNKYWRIRQIGRIERRERSGRSGQDDSQNCEQNALPIGEEAFFSNHIEKFICLLFEVSKENVSILAVLKTFFQFLFCNKIFLHQIGESDMWEKVYNYIYLSIVRNKAKKAFDHLMDILNILLCMYNSYGYKNERDKEICLDIKIKEFSFGLFGETAKSDNVSSGLPTFLFITFFKIREKSKLFVFPDHVTQNLRYSIMLNYPHFFL
ncbi:hypothetical protein PCYB_111110 [Plasmodium cynomolgi strain B]|uniref:Uncharacterized protein n=1 Tax=Plasmodium cynomolgi (strain B) TaxID=1120755 RepID=K6UXB3_PLACD|nr:hypothetical protein PCYB_111110 [Plasmodium cynomolgi strain B]GAB67090.1 hypothetical protein PCYB_111110 [Plasmodium cynomolgi strain B]